MVRENWGSRFGFIMATAGFAIGMGNIWRFPYIVGESGGGAFILVYLILTAIIGVPLLTARVSFKGLHACSPSDVYFISIWIKYF